ncbi:heme utilization protein [Pasteurellaceae bacterium LIM206]|nr:heme utilization protein [Pasteurellaceae bacterium LIM206]
MKQGIYINGKQVFSGINNEIKTVQINAGNAQTIVSNDSVISICGRGNIVVNGKAIELEQNGSILQIEVFGNVQNLTVGSADVTVNGDVENVDTSSGDVTIHGNVGSNVKTSSGDVYCKSITGAVNTVNGDVYR